MNASTAFDLPRALLQVLALGILIAASVWIVQPFLTALVWATTIVISTWPVMLALQRMYGGRRAPAVATLTMALLLLLIGPVSWGIDAIVGSTDDIVTWSRQLASMSIPQPPAWLASLPMVGDTAAARWQELAALTPEELGARLAPHAQNAALWIVQQVGSLGMLLVQFLMTVVISGILYANGETAAAGVAAFARRLAGAPGADAAVLAAQAIRGVALGVIVTAVLQTTLVAIGLAVVGVPFAAFLVALAFVLCVAQIGPLLVMLPTTIWVWYGYGAGWGGPFLLWSLLCGFIDNFVRPVLIRRGADLPLLLIFSGVIGGLLALGVIGLFLGPVILAVAYTLLSQWVAADEAPRDAVDPASSPQSS